MLIAGLIVVVGLYFVLPGVIAAARRHRWTLAIIACQIGAWWICSLGTDGPENLVLLVLLMLPVWAWACWPNAPRMRIRILCPYCGGRELYAREAHFAKCKNCGERITIRPITPPVAAFPVVPEAPPPVQPHRPQPVPSPTDETAARTGAPPRRSKPFPPAVRDSR